MHAAVRSTLRGPPLDRSTTRCAYWQLDCAHFGREPETPSPALEFEESKPCLCMAVRGRLLAIHAAAHMLDRNAFLLTRLGYAALLDRCIYVCDCIALAPAGRAGAWVGGWRWC